MEPPGRVEFSNSSGGWLDCSASGSPQPTIDWVHADGTAVTEIHGVRRVLRNGTLVLMPFAAAAYHQDIHNTIYRCIASNSVGRIVSRDVQVRAGKLKQLQLLIMHNIYYIYNFCIFFVFLWQLWRKPTKWMWKYYLPRAVAPPFCVVWCPRLSRNWYEWSRGFMNPLSTSIPRYKAVSNGTKHSTCLFGVCAYL